MKMKFIQQLLAASLIGRVLSLCPPTGPVLPPPTFAEGFDLPNLRSILDERTGSTASSFALQITSRNATVFEYYHTAPERNSSGVQKVRGDTVFRVCSVTKAVTVLALLREAPDSLDRPIMDFIPELQDSAKYAAITLRMLACQMGGVPRDGNAFDLYTSRGEELKGKGFPTPEPSDIPRCDTGNGSATCTRAQLFDLMSKNDVTWQPGGTAAYSDQAYILLGFALENITGIPYTELITKSIVEEVGLSGTSFDMPSLSEMMIPVGSGSAFASIDFGNFKATAGLYSTPNDLSTWLRAILNNQLLTPAQTRQWLKPVNFVSSVYAGVGMPWEIFRTANIASLSRPVDIYAKAGSVLGYAAFVALVPEFDIGVAITAAGNDAEPVSFDLLDLAAGHAVTALEELARSQVSERYAGWYGAANGTHINLTVDEGPGLRIQGWTRDGKFILPAVKGELDDGTVDARLYPIGQDNRWRIFYESTAPSSGKFLNFSCGTWLSVDSYRYANHPMDEAVFQLSSDRAEAVFIPGLKQEYRRI